MKKLMIAAILLIATGGVLSAQTNRQGNGTPGTNKSAPGFTDANSNSVCDTYESNSRQAVKVSGKGQRMNKGQVAGYGKGNGRCGSNATQGKRTGNSCCKREA